MKKIITILLVLIMVFSITACGGSSNSVEEELAGRWIAGYDFGLADEFIFDASGNVELTTSITSEAASRVTNVDTGTYIITEDEIRITWSDGKGMFLNYTFENGELSIINPSEYEGVEDTPLTKQAE